jgi:hypothetical protein
VRTHIVNGMCVAVDSNGHQLSEPDRLARLAKEEL